MNVSHTPSGPPVRTLIVASALAAGLGSPFLASASALTPGSVVISEFRNHGTAGTTDQFYEVANTTGATITLPPNTQIRGSDGSVARISDAAGTFGNGELATLEPYAKALVTSPGYSLDTYGLFHVYFGARGDSTTTADFGDTTSLRLLDGEPSSSRTRVLDSVAFSPSPRGFGEGRALTARPGARQDGEQSFVRLATAAGYPRDTNNNAADFRFVQTGATDSEVTAETDGLGAPGPEHNESDPFGEASSPTPQPASRIAVDRFNPADGPYSGQNLVREGSGNSGTVTVRRVITNNTGHPVHALRFRVKSLSTLGFRGSRDADLRLDTAPDETVTRNGEDVPVEGAILEGVGSPQSANRPVFDFAPQQPVGGGINASASPTRFYTGTYSQAAKLCPGEKLAVNVLFDVVRAGAINSADFAVEATVDADDTDTSCNPEE